MKSNKNKAAPGLGGNRTLTYILVVALIFFVGYYLVLPAFTPHGSTTTNTTSGGAGAPTISLTPGTDIPNTQVTLSGSNLPANKSVSVSFDGVPIAPANLTGTCTTTSASSGGNTATLSGCYFWVPLKTAVGTHKVVLTAGNSSASATFNVPQYGPPVTTVTVTLTSLSLGLVTQLVTRRVVDLSKERRMRAEVNAFNKEKRDVTFELNKLKKEDQNKGVIDQTRQLQAKLDKLKKREVTMRQEQAKTSTARLKVTGITFIPLLAVYYLMATFLGGYGVIVAYTPIPIPLLAAPTLTPGLYEVSLFWWYFLSSFTFSTMLTKLLHTQP
jgi:uncharacterized membrane protein (DUF106 family)